MSEKLSFPLLISNNQDELDHLKELLLENSIEYLESVVNPPDFNPAFSLNQKKSDAVFYELSVSSLDLEKAKKLIETLSR